MKFIELELNRKRLQVVAGLVWHPLQGAGSARSKELLSFAKASEADLKVERGDDTPHVGFAQKTQGAKVGMISAAAVIADALAAENPDNRSVLVALPLPEDPGNVLYISVRDSVILADGDTVAPAEQVRQRLQEDKSFGGWAAVICPAEWGEPGSEERSFDSFFTTQVLKKPKRWQLAEVQVDVIKLIVVLALIAAVGMGSVYGWGAWKKRQALAAAMAEAQRQQAEQEAAARSLRAANTSPPAPWPAMPSAPIFARACVDAFVHIGVTAGNWKFDGAACENGRLSVRWIKASEAAWVSHLKAVRPEAVIAADGMSATVAMPINAPASGNRGEVLQDAVALRLRYFDLASRYGMSIKVDPPQAPPAPQVLPGQKEGPSPPPPQWAETAVQVTAGFNPVEAAALLDSPGLRFNKLVFAYTKDGLPQYQFTGVQYARP